MVFQNSFYISKLKTKNFLGVIIIVSLILILMLIEGILREFGLSVVIPYSVRIPIALCCIAAYIFYVYMQQKKNIHFIYFTDEDNNHLVFRYYHVKIIGKKYTTYKIPVTSFYSYKILEDNPYKELALFQVMPNNQIAKYPPISLAALSEHEIKTLTDALKPYCKKK